MTRRQVPDSLPEHVAELHEPGREPSHRAIGEVAHRWGLSRRDARSLLERGPAAFVRPAVQHRAGRPAR